jgi:hypothetical protein
MKVFYSHLIILDDVVAQLDEYQIEASEREELVTLVEQIMHHHALNVVLNHLPKEKHPEFLEGMEKDPGNSQWLDFLKKEIKGDIESAIRQQSEKIKKEVLLEIKRSKRS